MFIFHPVHIKPFIPVVFYCRKRSYFERVKILVPKTWTTIHASPAVDETFESAEIIVDNPNPAYGDNPYTVQVHYRSIIEKDISVQFQLSTACIQCSAV